MALLPKKASELDLATKIALKDYKELIFAIIIKTGDYANRHINVIRSDFETEQLVIEFFGGGPPFQLSISGVTLDREKDMITGPYSVSYGTGASDIFNPVINNLGKITGSIPSSQWSAGNDWVAIVSIKIFNPNVIA